MATEKAGNDAGEYYRQGFSPSKIVDYPTHDRYGAAAGPYLGRYRQNVRGGLHARFEHQRGGGTEVGIRYKAVFRVRFEFAGGHGGACFRDYAA